MTQKTKRALFLAVYIILILLPLIIFFSFPYREKREFWREFSVLLGFLGLSIAGMQFVPVARLPHINNLFDLDRMYKVHHMLSVTSVFMVMLHPLILLFNNPNVLPLFNIFKAPWRAQAGWIGLIGLFLIAFTSVLRQQIKLGYNAWLFIHDVLVVIILAFGLIHMFKVDYHMGSPAMIAAWIVMIIIWAGLSLYIRLVKPLLLSTRPFMVKQVVQESPDTYSLILEPKNERPHVFKAGQVAWINIGKTPFHLVRYPFSYSSSAENSKSIRFSIKKLGDFTSTIADLKGGETAFVDGPYGNFDLANPHTQKGLVLLAGGIGLAPIMSILHTLADQNDTRPVYVFYGDYSQDTLLFSDEFAGLQPRLNMTLVTVLEKGSDQPGFEKGYITKKLLENTLPENKHDLYYFICGPLPMIHAMESILHHLKVPHHQIISEKYEMA